MAELMQQLIRPIFDAIIALSVDQGGVVPEGHDPALFKRRTFGQQVPKPQFGFALPCIDCIAPKSMNSTNTVRRAQRVSNKVILIPYSGSKLHHDLGALVSSSSTTMLENLY